MLFLPSKIGVILEETEALGDTALILVKSTSLVSIVRNFLIAFPKKAFQ